MMKTSNSPRSGAPTGTGMAQEWNIRPRGEVCALCAEPFEDKQLCVSTLRKRENDYERMDFCMPCWRDTPRDWTPFSFWESVYEIPPAVPVRKEPIKKETAESLLRHLIALDDPAMQHVIYVLAVMLERGKQLIERDARPDERGGILRIYEHRKSGDTFLVLDPRLRLDQLAPVQQQVVALLSGTHALEADRPTPPAPAP